MSQFTVYKNNDKKTYHTYPYFVDVQSDLLYDLNSRMVIPLSPHTTVNKTSAKKLCPTFNIENEKFVLLTHQMTSIPFNALKTEITSFESYRYEIIDAIDMLVSGI